MKFKFGYGPWFLARIFVGLVFVYAGFSKLMEPVENFRAVILQYEVIPYAFAVPIAYVFPWVELIFGAFLILGYAARLSAFVLGLSSLTFLIILGTSNALLEGGASDCGCFGEGSFIHLSTRQVFALDLVNFFLALKLFLTRNHSLSLDEVLRRR